MLFHVCFVTTIIESGSHALIDYPAAAELWGEIIGCRRPRWSWFGLDNAELAEAMAIRPGISVARDSGFWPVTVESDSLSVINLLMNKYVS
ncbi:hypothetical protein TorRG33x02_078110 [Trema orientale]|uniref:RNase H type-1 domain-containing protein n=1 Tax=Trema orientale TaxID=63057 RepID=A0A2P5FFG8_TREOI|nr:hypothetical protein TorRG33x02_078110 [Trema orientale]